MSARNATMSRATTNAALRCPAALSEKRFRLDPAAAVALAPGRGACIASDRVTVDGARVGYLYREEPDFPSDSGWRFWAGDESPDYAADASNFELFDVNTIANCDRDIVPLLDAPPGSAFARDAEGRLAPAPAPDELRLRRGRRDNRR